MTLPVILRRLAQAEFDDAADWYEGRRFFPLLTSGPATGEWSTTSRECGATAPGRRPNSFAG
jgi:hypothetical protein